MFGMGPQEILIILVIALLFIGPKKLPEIAKALGKGFGELKQALDDVKQQVDLESMIKDQETNEDQPPKKDMDTLLQETFPGSPATRSRSEESETADERQEEKNPEETENR